MDLDAPAPVPWLGLAALGLLAAFAAVCAAGIGSGPVALAGAAAIAVGAAVLMVALSCRRRVVVRADKLGWSNGLTAPGHWTAVGDVAHVAAWKMSNAKAGVHHGVVLFTVAGGFGPVAGWFARAGISAADAAAVRGLEQVCGLRLRTFLVPVGDMRGDDVAQLERFFTRTLPVPLTAATRAVFWDARHRRIPHPTSGGRPGGLIDADDWRLAADDPALVDAVLRWQRWTGPNPAWHHDHCELCWAELSDDPDTAHVRTGLVVVADPRKWICPRCVTELAGHFGWTVEGDGPR